MYYIIISFAVIIILWVFSLTKTRFAYWKKRGVPTLKEHNFIFGDFLKTFLGKEHFIICVDEVYREFKSRGCAFGGIYSMNNPMLLVIDPKILRLVLTKDFTHFADRGIEYDTEKKPLSGHMFNLSGDEWKFIRKKVTPTFTSGKLKTMFWIIEEKVDKLCEVISKDCGNTVQLNTLLERTGMEIIAQTAFGINSNTLDEDNSPFFQVTKSIFYPKMHRVLYYAFKYIFKNYVNIALLASDDHKCNQFFLDIVKNTIKTRKDDNVRINDLLQLLIDLMEPKDGEEGLSLEAVTAQVFMFFVAGYETTSKTIEMVMYELGKELEMQERLREEIVDVLNEADGKFSYEIVMKCKLLDMVVLETLRKHSPLSFLNRICTKNFKIPGTDMEIEKGTPIIVPVYSIHMDPDNFENPKKFDPYRFSKDNENSINPYTFLAFGEGPRNCIGSRLGLYQAKLSIMKLIKNFKVVISPKTEEPLTFNKITDSIVLKYKEKLYFNFELI